MVNLKLRSKKIIVILIIFILSNLILWSVLAADNYKNMGVFEGVNRRENNNTFIASNTVPQLLLHLSRVSQQNPVEEDSPHHRVIEVDTAGNIVWEKEGFAHPHDIVEMENDNLMIADTGFDRVCEIEYESKEITWEWKPEDIDWEQINNDTWDSAHYFNNPIEYDWTHLNDVNFKDYDGGNWTAMLVSIRNFDLIVEVNYTSAKNRDKASAEDIVWYFGDYLDKTKLNHQHNPHYLENGNILVADSENHRIIEVDRESKEIVWEYNKGLTWARDADELDNGNILITDIHRVFEIDKDTKEIEWEYSGDLMFAYEADRLENENTLIGGGLGGVVYEVDKDGNVVWSYGVSYILSVSSLNLLLLMTTHLFSIGLILKPFITGTKEEKKKMSKKKRRALLILSGLIFVELIILFNIPDIAAFISTLIKDLGSY
ncbi:MAG: PQQ-binding-like beta-propeller repeat protein [Promethearchaeia archaeon]